MDKLKNILKDKRTVAVILIIIAVLICAAFLYLNSENKNRPIATVYVDGKPVMDFDLEKITDRQVVDLNESLGIPVKFELIDHKVRFFEVTCPDKICEKTGFLDSDMDIASCIPNRTMLVVEEGKD